MEEDLKEVAKILVEPFQRHAALRDAAAAYWPSLTFRANLEHCVRTLDGREHGHALELIRYTEECAEKQLNDAAASLEVRVEEFLAEKASETDGVDSPRSPHGDRWYGFPSLPPPSPETFVPYGRDTSCFCSKSLS